MLLLMHHCCLLMRWFRFGWALWQEAPACFVPMPTPLLLPPNLQVTEEAGLRKLWLGGLCQSQALLENGKLSLEQPEVSSAAAHQLVVSSNYAT